MVDQVGIPEPNPPASPSLSELAAKARGDMIRKVGEPEPEKEKGLEALGRINTPIAGPKPAEWFFEAPRPNFGFIYRLTRKQVKFEGFCFRTEDAKLAKYISKCYGGEVNEITKEQYEECTTLKPGAPEPAKTTIVVNRLPELNT